MQTQGEGDILVSAFGDILPLEVTPDHPITLIMNMWLSG